MTQIYISDPVHPAVLERAHQHASVYLGYGPTAVDYDTIASRIEAVLLRGENFDDARIAGSPELRIIARHGVGYDNVDVESASARGIWVTTTPGSNSRAVAEHVFALILTVARKIPEAVSATANRRWGSAKPDLVGIEIHGRTLGLLGYGSIARFVAEIARGFGMTVIAHDPYADPAALAADGTTAVDIDELATQSDVLSIHVPLTNSIRGIIDSHQLKQMKDETILVNTSRGGIVDEDALAEALASGSIRGAAVDVLASEETDMKEPLKYSRLAEENIPNLVITPHIAGQTEEAFRNSGDRALDAILSVMSGEVPEGALVTPHSITMESRTLTS